VRYSPIKDVDVSLGAKYFWLGDADAKVSSGTKVGEFEGNDAVAVGLKLGYHF
jgi:long-chain fatty acid transport protein